MVIVIPIRPPVVPPLFLVIWPWPVETFSCTGDYPYVLAEVVSEGVLEKSWCRQNGVNWDGRQPDPYSATACVNCRTSAFPNLGLRLEDLHSADDICLLAQTRSDIKAKLEELVTEAAKV